MQAFSLLKRARVAFSLMRRPKAKLRQQISLKYHLKGKLFDDLSVIVTQNPIDLIIWIVSAACYNIVNKILHAIGL